MITIEALLTRPATLKRPQVFHAAPLGLQVHNLCASLGAVILEGARQLVTLRPRTARSWARITLTEPRKALRVTRGDLDSIGVSLIAAPVMARTSAIS